MMPIAGAKHCIITWMHNTILSVGLLLFFSRYSMYMHRLSKQSTDFFFWHARLQKLEKFSHVTPQIFQPFQSFIRIKMTIMGAAVAQSVRTWLGNQRVVSSSPVRTDYMYVCMSIGPVCARVCISACGWMCKKVTAEWKECNTTTYSFSLNFC